MAEHFIAVSEDGLRFRLKTDSTWEPDANATHAPVIGFRSSRWGDSQSQVKSVESGEVLAEDPTVLVYETNVADFPVNLAFGFVNGLLSTGIYGFTQKHVHDGDYLHDFDTIRDLLIVKYGKPASVDEYWANELYRDDTTQWGMAVSCGHYSKFVTWADSGTEIVLQITGDNYEIRLSLIYKSKQLKPLVLAQRQEKLLAGL